MRRTLGHASKELADAKEDWPYLRGQPSTRTTPTQPTQLATRQAAVGAPTAGRYALPHGVADHGEHQHLGGHATVVRRARAAGDADKQRRGWASVGQVLLTGIGRGLLLRKISVSAAASAAVAWLEHPCKTCALQPLADVLAPPASLVLVCPQILPYLL